MLPKQQALLTALKTSPVAQDQFGGADFPGSYKWQRGSLAPEQFHAGKVLKYAMPKAAKIKAPVVVHIPHIGNVHIPHIPSAGVKFNAR